MLMPWTWASLGLSRAITSSAVEVRSGSGLSWMNIVP
jgi:hypothetical protein